jgi:hypothetical protein
VKNIAQLLQINGSNESKERKENFVLHFGGIVQKKCDQQSTTAKNTNGFFTARGRCGVWVTSF